MYFYERTGVGEAGNRVGKKPTKRNIFSSPSSPFPCDPLFRQALELTKGFIENLKNWVDDNLGEF